MVNTNHNNTHKGAGMALHTTLINSLSFAPISILQATRDRGVTSEQIWEGVGRGFVRVVRETDHYTMIRVLA